MLSKYFYYKIIKQNKNLINFLKLKVFLSYKYFKNLIKIKNKKIKETF